MFGIDADHLHQPKRPITLRCTKNRVARAHVCADILRDAILYHNAITLTIETRRLYCFLWTHSEIDDIHNHLEHASNDAICPRRSDDQYWTIASIYIVGDMPGDAPFTRAIELR
jgi:hypothetical protein